VALDFTIKPETIFQDPDQIIYNFRRLFKKKTEIGTFDDIKKLFL